MHQSAFYAEESLAKNVITLGIMSWHYLNVINVIVAKNNKNCFANLIAVNFFVLNVWAQYSEMYMKELLIVNN